MTYKEALTKLWTGYAQSTYTRYVGYNTACGSRMYGTLSNIEVSRCIEMPVAENLMVGMGVGMALEGFRPVVCFERHDFLLLGLDAIVNHLDKLPYLSGWQYKLPVIIRAIVGASKPLYVGPQHSKDYTAQLIGMLEYTPVREFTKSTSYEEMLDAVNMVGKTPSGAVVIIEHRDLYDINVPTLTETTTGA